MDVQSPVNARDETIRQIMLLSHERGQELSTDDVLREAKRLTKYLKKSGIKNVDLDYSLLYLLDLLESKDD